MSGVGDVLAVGGRHQACYAHVDPDDGAGRRQWLRRNSVAGEHEIPAATFPFRAYRLHRSSDRAVLVDPHMPDALEVHPSCLPAWLRVPPTAIPVGWPCDGVEPATTLEPGVTGRAAVLDTTEEGSHRLVQASQGGLLGGEGPAALLLRIEGANVLQFGGLPAVAHGDPCHPVRGAAVLQCGVVELPMVFEARRECAGLSAGWAQEELIGASRGVPLDGDSVAHAVALLACGKMAARWWAHSPKSETGGPARIWP